MIYNLINIWKKYDFEIVVFISILFLIIGALTRIGKKGTYSTTNYYPYYLEAQKTKKRGTDSKGEIRCRNFLENYFKVSFSKSRPNFLNNPVSGGMHNLELDCYNDKLKIAVEYNGIQHYKFTPYFHKNNEAFMNQKYRDYMKKTICRENGILLIEVPYNINDIETFLRGELNKKLSNHFSNLKKSIY